MLLALRQLLQENSLGQTVQEELSIFSGGTLHHVGQLLAHTLMYHATLVVSPKGRHIQRLLLSACCLADILPGEVLTCTVLGVLRCLHDRFFLRQIHSGMLPHGKAHSNFAV